MFTKPLYILIALLSALATAQEIPAGVSSSLGAINPTVYSSATSVLSASSASIASAEATSMGGANAHGELFLGVAVTVVHLLEIERLTFYRGKICCSVWCWRCGFERVHVEE
jgi:hypothetical protein